jgi:hypothetical protein
VQSTCNRKNRLPPVVRVPILRINHAGVIPTSHTLSLLGTLIQFIILQELVALISDKAPRRQVVQAEQQEELNSAMQKLSDSHGLAVTLPGVQRPSRE